MARTRIATWAFSETLQRFQHAGKGFLPTWKISRHTKLFVHTNTITCRPCLLFFLILSTYYVVIRMRRMLFLPRCCFIKARNWWRNRDYYRPLRTALPRKPHFKTDTNILRLSTRRSGGTRSCPPQTASSSTPCRPHLASSHGARPAQIFAFSEARRQTYNCAGTGFLMRTGEAAW